MFGLMTKQIAEGGDMETVFILFVREHLVAATR